MAFLWGSIRWIVAITIVCWAVFIISMVIDRRRYQNAIYFSASVLSLLVLLGSVCGKALSSIIVAVVRKFVLLIPLIYIIPALVEDKTTAVYMAEPVADLLAVTFTTILFYFQFKKAMAELENRSNMGPELA